jgi:hypothetical protein
MKYFIISENDIIGSKDFPIINQQVPIHEFNNGYFAEQILKELIEKGLGGPELFEEFKKMNAKVRPAIKEMISEADKIARESKGSGDDEMREIFGD